ncbi:MAG: FAD-dependent oxidoreductase [Actinobacteria bacterium]|nr:FAD-dependent oxidoreductase [Actinomycetota bacterium]
MNPIAALADARPEVLWLDRIDRPAPAAALHDATSADLVVVGGGFCGLWTAILAKERDPSRDVVVIDAGRVAAQASGRNGGFLSSSLTHGLDNGLAHFPKQMGRIARHAADNFAEIRRAVERYDIDCDWSECGALTVATAPHLAEEFEESAAVGRRFGHDIEVLDRDAIRARVDSPTYHGAMFQRDGEALVDPARLAWGLAAAARSLGVRIYENTAMTRLERHGAAMTVSTGHGSIRSGAVVLATNAFRSPVRRINRTIAPVYDYVLATEPLTEAQMASIGWSGREGLSDTTNQFHYYRLTDDNRIVWGGYDAVYYFGSRIDPSLDQRDETHRVLAEHFFQTFPQLDGLRFTHRWGGVIDTCSRFSVSFGTAFDGRVAYAVGFTGLGVGATRFAGSVCLDLLDRPESEVLTLDLVRKRPIPFPPEPIRWAGITATRRALAAADANGGRRGPWLRLLDAIGLGFDS